MTDDIVTRLRIACRQEGAEYCGECQPCQAADEIERLRAELQKEKQAHWKHHLYKGAEILNMPDKAACDE